MAKSRVVPEMGLTDEEQAAADEIGSKTKRIKPYTRAAARGKRQVDKRTRAPSAHASRATEARDAEPTHDAWDEPWVRSGTLPEIPARKGMVQRWIRTSIGATADTTNLSRKLREGWRPRKVDTLPAGFQAPTIEHGAYAGCVVVESMLLCEMPTARNDQRNAYFAKRKNTQTDAVNQQLAEASRHGSSAFGVIQKAEVSQVGRLREVKEGSE